MCGRYSLTSPGEALAELLGLPEGPPHHALPEPRYNVAPTNPMPIVRLGGGGREWAVATWGFEGHQINARAETVNRQPGFRAAFRSRRCLVPADGFYEWLKDGRHRQPYYLRRRDRRPFAFAGLWEDATFTILTCPPNELVAPIHDRMPVILPRAQQDLWLSAKDPITALDLLTPAPAAAFEAYAVGREVNRVDHDAPDCIAPLPVSVPPPPRQGELFFPAPR